MHQAANAVTFTVHVDSTVRYDSNKTSSASMHSININQFLHYQNVDPNIRYRTTSQHFETMEIQNAEQTDGRKPKPTHKML